MNQLEQQLTQFPEINLNNYTGARMSLEAIKEVMSIHELVYESDYDADLMIRACNELSFIIQERNDARQAARWEADLAEQAIQDLKTMTAERDALKEKLKDFDGLTDVGWQWMNDKWTSSELCDFDLREQCTNHGIDTRTIYTFTDSAY